MTVQPIALWQIEDAIKPQFVWDLTSNSRLQLKLKMFGRGSLGMARTVLVGIACSYLIPPRDIAEYIGVNVQSIPMYLARFHLAHNRPVDEKTVIQVHMVTKTQIVQNFIKLHYHLKTK